MNQQSPPEKKCKKRFTKQEDTCILRLYEEISDSIPKKWDLIGQKFQLSFPQRGKTAKQLRDRYRYFIDPNINRTKISIEEGEDIMKNYGEIGPFYVKIANRCKNRAPQDIKNFIRDYMKKKKKEEGQINEIIFYVEEFEQKDYRLPL